MGSSLLHQASVNAEISAGVSCSGAMSFTAGPILDFVSSTLFPRCWEVTRVY